MNTSNFGKKKRQPVEKRGRQFLQRCVDIEIKQSKIKGAGKGAYALRDIKKGEVLNFYKGKKITGQQYEKMTKDSDYAFSVTCKGKEILYDAQKVKDGNWTRYMNHARGRTKGENVEPYYYGCKVYFRTIRPIKKGTELLFDYGDDYWV
jgi:SET domain-containing protein